MIVQMPAGIEKLTEFVGSSEGYSVCMDHDPREEILGTSS